MDSFSKSHFRAVAYFEFLQGHSAPATYDNMCAAFKKEVVCKRTVYRWFEEFGSGDFSLEDKPRSGRPPVLENEALENALKEKPNATTRELARRLGSTHQTINSQLRALGYRKVLSVWIPHELRDSDRANRMSICQSLLLRPHRKDFLRNVVTGDESWVLYANHTRERQWLPRGQPPKKEAKPDLYD